MGFIAFTSAILLLAPIAIAYFSGFIQEFFNEGIWRELLLAPVIVIYIIALWRPMQVSQMRAVRALQKVILLDDESFKKLVRDSSHIDDRAELLAFVLGAIIGFWLYAPWRTTFEYPLVKVYMALSRELMFGCLGWIIFVSLASTKLQTILHQQPMKIDIFNIDPFEPIGRHSLLLALIFLGGTVISLIFRPLAEGIDIAFVVIYAALIVVIVLIFFLSMRHTHRVLADAKTAELDEVERKIASSFRSLRVSHLKMTEEIPETFDINLWLKYEERLKKTRTWPYNTAMLRTLFLSALVPAIISLAQRLLSSLLFN